MGSASSSSSRSSKKTTKANCGGESIPEETDDRVRKAEIYMGKCALGGDGNAAGTLNHWFLAIKFDDCWVTMEANNYYGKLTAIYEKRTTTPSGTLYKINEIGDMNEFQGIMLSMLIIPTLGVSFLLMLARACVRIAVKFNIRVSPQQLRDITCNHPHNNTDYDLTNNNCQTWALFATSKIDAI